jgi:hypothetical protein
MPFRREISLFPALAKLQSNRVFSFSLRSLVRGMVFCGAIGVGITGATFAQETPAAETKPSPSPAARTPDDKPPATPSPNPVTMYNFLERKSFVFPDIALGSERLSTGQKFQLFVDNSISLDTVAYAAMGSAIGQADDSPTGFGEGWDAYGKRFGTSMARQASTEFFGTFILASALHEDPRFYAEVNPRFMHAVKYSVQRVFIMKSDDGRDVVAWSKLAGPLMAEGLANVYWPDRNRSAGDTLFRYGIDLAAKAGGNMLREYWPVLHSKMRHSQPAPAHR